MKYINWKTPKRHPTALVASEMIFLRRLYNPQHSVSRLNWTTWSKTIFLTNLLDSMKLTYESFELFSRKRLLTKWTECSPSHEPSTTSRLCAIPSFSGDFLEYSTHSQEQHDPQGHHIIQTNFFSTWWEDQIKLFVITSQYSRIRIHADICSRLGIATGRLARSMTDTHKRFYGRETEEKVRTSHTEDGTFAVMNVTQTLERFGKKSSLPQYQSTTIYCSI